MLLVNLLFDEFKYKEFVFGKSLTSSTLSKDLNTFITIGNDFVNIRLTFGLRYTTPDNLVDQMRQKIITKDELFNEPKVDYVQGLTDIINDVVRLRGVPPEQTKLQEFKHVSKNWKNFIS